MLEKVIKSIKKLRVIILYKIENIDISLPIISFDRIQCSKGTYIRSIARDLGNKA